MIFSAAFLIQSSLQQLQASTTTDERGDETLSPEMADAIHDLQEQLKDVTDIRYEGQFEADVIHGFGKQTFLFADGRTHQYDGQWVGGLSEGNGAFRDNENNLYLGTWTQGVQHGPGVEIFATGGTYTGDFTNGAQEGFGRLAEVQSFFQFNSFHPFPFLSGPFS